MPAPFIVASLVRIEQLLVNLAGAARERKAEQSEA
jgi:hypothetical protein